MRGEDLKRLLAFVILAGLILCNADSVQAVGVGETAPDFQGKTLEGKSFSLADYKGEPILLKIGTTWCPSCREQAKSIDSIHEYLAEKGVRFVDVFIDESEASVKKYFNKGNYRKPSIIVLDDGAVHKAYNVYVIPRLVLIDKDFKVVRDGDTTSARNLIKKIEKMLRRD